MTGLRTSSDGRRSLPDELLAEGLSERISKEIARPPGCDNGERSLADACAACSSALTRCQFYEVLSVW
jgi:hypothetical protein